MADCEAEPVDVAGGEPAAAGAPVHGGANTVSAAGAGADEDAPVTAGAQTAGAAVTHTHADGGGGEGGHDAAYVYPEGDDGPIMWDTFLEEGDGEFEFVLEMLSEFLNTVVTWTRQALQKLAAWRRASNGEDMTWEELYRAGEAVWMCGYVLRSAAQQVFMNPLGDAAEAVEHACRGWQELRGRSADGSDIPVEGACCAALSRYGVASTACYSDVAVAGCIVRGAGTGAAGVDAGAGAGAAPSEHPPAASAPVPPPAPVARHLTDSLQREDTMGTIGGAEEPGHDDSSGERIGEHESDGY